MQFVQIIAGFYPSFVIVLYASRKYPKVVVKPQPRVLFYCFEIEK